MEVETITRAAHEAAREWFDESVPDCWQHPWEELADKEKNFLRTLTKDIIADPDTRPVINDFKSPRQIFLEGIFWGTVRNQHASQEGDTK